LPSLADECPEWEWYEESCCLAGGPWFVGGSKTPRRYANALRRLLARTETVTFVVHELSLRYILAAAATGSSPVPGIALPNAVP